jgi:hypothetical protein
MGIVLNFNLLIPVLELIPVTTQNTFNLNFPLICYIDQEISVVKSQTALDNTWC